jgi:glutamyl-tRNA synthetase
VDEVNVPYVGRFAPSPTGKMHLGVARTMLAAWLDARKHGGRILMRIEDIDLHRNVPGAAEAMIDDLHWLGLDFDGEVIFQSQRFSRYEAIVEELRRKGRIFECFCSRKEIALASSAPHGANDEGPRYPGTCRAGTTIRADRIASLRFRTEPEDFVAHTDRRYGVIDQDVHQIAGDFVLKRGDGMWAYQLAVSADDLDSGVTQIVRGADLLHSTPRQILIRRTVDPRALPLSTLHLPLILGPSGVRLAKRDGAIAVADQRAAGRSAEAILGELAFSLGQVESPAPISARSLVDTWDTAKIPLTDRKVGELVSGTPR